MHFKHLLKSEKYYSDQKDSASLKRFSQSWPSRTPPSLSEYRITSTTNVSSSTFPNSGESIKLEKPALKGVLRLTKAKSIEEETEIAEISSKKAERRPTRVTFRDDGKSEKKSAKGYRKYRKEKYVPASAVSEMETSTLEINSTTETSFL